MDSAARSSATSGPRRRRTKCQTIRDTEVPFDEETDLGGAVALKWTSETGGLLLDLEDNEISPNDPHKFSKAVHLKDVHLAHGMQCADCHFDVDVHGNGMLYGEPRNATTITCIDCHGTIEQRPTLITTGNAGQIEYGKSVGAGE